MNFKKIYLIISLIYFFLLIIFGFTIWLKCCSHPAWIWLTSSTVILYFILWLIIFLFKKYPSYYKIHSAISALSAIILNIASFFLPEAITTKLIFLMGFGLFGYTIFIIRINHLKNLYP